MDVIRWAPEVPCDAWEAEIDWGDFKGYDKKPIRKAEVRVHGTLVGRLAYETGTSSMVLLNGWLTVARLRPPDDVQG